MTSSESEPKTLRQRLLPQISIRFFLIVIALSAVAMVTFRSALLGNQTWAMIAALLIATTISCFTVYALIFLMANMFTAGLSPIYHALEREHESGDQPATDAHDGDG